MFKKSELTRAGARNLYSYLNNYLDYEKLNIDEKRYTQRLEYLYGWLYPRAALVDEYLLNIALIESELFKVFDTEILLEQSEDYIHLIMEMEEISFILSYNSFYEMEKYPISRYLIEFYDKLLLIGGMKNIKYNRKLLYDIRKDLEYSYNLRGNMSHRFITHARILKG